MKPLIIANWKMNPQSLADAKRLFNSVKEGIKNIKNVETVICPPFVFLSSFKFQVSSLRLGSQDCFYEEKGAFTGEISPLMLKNLGCQYVIIGHSERRKLGETDEMINKKIKAAISIKLKPILCIGETEKEKREGKTFQVLKNQTKKALQSIVNSRRDKSLLHPSLRSGSQLSIVVAYEPVWAIGTGKACSPVEAKKANFFIKKLLTDIPVLYGGSVNSQNAVNYIKEAEFSGLLVGGASLNSKEFIEIVKKVSYPSVSEG